MNHRERDRLQVLHGVTKKQYRPAKAAELLGLCSRQVRRLHQRLRAQGDAGLVHRLRGKPSKGRVERLFGTTQDRWVKELRLAQVRTLAAANQLLDASLLADDNRRFAVAAAASGDAHRAGGTHFPVAAILSIQEPRVVANDSTIRFPNRLYPLDKPIYPGERGGKVIAELRLDGTMAIRFGSRYLHYHEITSGPAVLGFHPPNPPEFNAGTADARGEKQQGPRLDTGDVVRWRTADHRVLGSHSCGALSCRWHRTAYRSRTLPTTRHTPLEADISSAVRHPLQRDLKSAPRRLILARSAACHK
jgi:hypothetical protein